MKNLKSFTVAVILILLPLLLNSCSSSDKSSNDNSQITEAQAQQMQALAAALVPMTSVVSTAGVNKVDGVEEGDYDFSEFVETGEDVTITVGYDNGGGWWDSYFAFNIEGDTAISLTMRDSVRFEITGGAPQQFPDDNTNLVREVARLALIASLEGMGDIDLSMRSDVTMSELQAASVVINGNQSFDFDADIVTDEGAVSGTVSASLEITDLVVPKPSFDGEVTCPTSGMIVLTVTEDLTAQAVNQGKVQATWSITVTVIGPNSYRIRLQGDGQNFGEVTVNEECGSSLSVAKRLLSASAGVMQSAAPLQ